ncbi:MAG: response regulator [Deltaproteobacteria bacterium]|nr:response regulator [Deltaproteobacteria bacterium]
MAGRGVRSVLVVDGDAVLLSHAKASLEAARYRVAVATNVVDADRLASTEQPDLAIVELFFDRRRIGLELARGLKATVPGMKVVLCSGWLNTSTAEQASAGVDHAFNKLCSYRDIVKAAEGRVIVEPDLDDMPSLAFVSRAHVERVFTASSNNVTLTAQRLKIDRSALQRLRKKARPHR